MTRCLVTPGARQHIVGAPRLTHLNKIVSKVDEIVFASRSTLCVTRPMVDAPHDMTCNSWSLKKRVPLGTAVSGSLHGMWKVFPSKDSDMARKKGEHLKSWAVEKINSQSPVWSSIVPSPLVIRPSMISRASATLAALYPSRL